MGGFYAGRDKNKDLKGSGSEWRAGGTSEPRLTEGRSEGAWDGGFARPPRAKSPIFHQQKENFFLPKVLFLFIQAAGLAYLHRAKCGAYHQGRRAALDLITHQRASCLRLDDIQCFALMIYRNRLRMIYKAPPWFISKSVIEWIHREIRTCRWIYE